MTGHTTAIVTASYAPDFERCRLLCETIDAHVTGYSCHYILVESADVALFKQLERPKRKIIDERALLPSWLKVFPDPLSLGKRRIWLSTKTMPMRGWHSQQLRRIAIAKLTQDDAYFYCDSDTVFIKDFDVTLLWQGDNLRLFRRNGALAKTPKENDQHVWAANAAHVLDLDPARVQQHDYIGTLIAWRRDTMLAMCDQIEKTTGRHWVAALGKRRRFSECMIYGQYADICAGQVGHYIDNNELCEMFWMAPMPSEQEFVKRVRAMNPHQVALGIQSFLSGDVSAIRKLIAKAKH